MRVAVVGLGTQGKKRIAIAGRDVSATVDPVAEQAEFKSILDVPLSRYDAALVCTPDPAKFEILNYLLENGRHVLVEKPLLADRPASLCELAALAKRSGAICYTAYNHRFEPHFVRLHDLLREGTLGEIYLCRMFYGNGTARDVRASPWRDRGAGVLTDLGSHLLDTALFWFGSLGAPLRVSAANCFENRALDHIAFGGGQRPVLEFEATLLSWRNHFTCDVFAEKGSAHIESLCKWGPSSFTLRRRILPSGRPPEESVTLVQADPTWALEYAHFKSICETGAGSNMETDILINERLNDLAVQAAMTGRRS